ncbi:MAG: hypothetical protein WDA14_12240, partial [Sphaerochaetaceae bacterium]
MGQKGVVAVKFSTILLVCALLLLVLASVMVLVLALPSALSGNIQWLSNSLSWFHQHIGLVMFAQPGTAIAAI